MAEKADKENRRPSRILMWCYLLSLVGSFIVAKNIYDIQHNWEPIQKYERHFLPSKHMEKTMPRRGSIIDHNGKLLAISTPLYNVYMDCYVLKAEFDADKKEGKSKNEKWLAKSDTLAMGLAEILNTKGKDAGYYSKLIRDGRAKGKRHVLIARKVDLETLKKLRTLPLFNEAPNRGGFKMEELENRMYPYEGLARRTIGYVNRNNPDGYIGIEGNYDHVLAGKAGVEWARRTDKFAWISDVDSVSVQVEDGLDVRTTIDINIQDIAERALRQHIDTARHINSACAVILEVESGAVRAMVNLKRDSLGRMRESFNMAAGCPSEPGSIFKTVILTTLLEDGLTSLEKKMHIDIEHMHYPGIKKPERDRYAFRYKDKYKTNHIPVIDGLMISSNYVFRRQVVDCYQDRPQELIARLHSYNLGADFNFELTEPGSSRSSIPDPSGSDWSASTLPSVAIGYSVMVTPLQILAFYNAIANGGRMMKPYIVESLEKNGEAVEKFDPVLMSVVCSQATTDTLVRALRKVTEGVDGTAYSSMKGARCSVAGKTGTAWIGLEKKERIGARGSYELADGSRKYQASFAGFFPAEDPKYSAIVVAYTDPMRGRSEGGGNKPAKVFRQIVNDIWAYDSRWRREIN